MDTGIRIRAAALPDDRRAGSARAPVLARAFPALSAIRSRLGLVVLGLDQGRISEHRIWNHSGAHPVCGDAAQSAALVAVFLVPSRSDSPGSDRDHSPGDRPPVQQVRTSKQPASELVAAIEKLTNRAGV